MKTKTMKPMAFTLMAALICAMAASVVRVQAQGMPPESRKNIHTLFSNHAKLTRTVEKTDKGYVATTESDDPQVVAALREHVKQMSARLESGLMVRRWDPAFAEYVEHYKDIKHRFEKTNKGVRMTVTGKTPAAIKVAQNHAAVISEFVKDGWSAHDRSHPAVAQTKETPTAAQGCCAKGKVGTCCARQAGK
ncbi:MAG TPA: hypothetical protein VNT99_09790 [Methylomirabilota bacterium]|nr:hypothetical protein [Methylomirabilota bacterium]